MNTIIIYASKTGFTKQYATWLSEELHATMLDYHQVSREQIQNADCVIFGGSLYAIGIEGVQVIQNYWDLIKEKKLIIYATGASPWSVKVVEDIVSSNFSVEERAHLSFYYLRGGFNYKKLPFLDKVKMRLLMMKISMKKKSKRNADEIGMLAIFKRGMDYTKKSYLQPILEEVRSIKK